MQLKILNDEKHFIANSRLMLGPTILFKRLLMLMVGMKILKLIPGVLKWDKARN